MPDLVYLLVFSATAVVYLFIISKILGKKQIAQLEFIDYVVGISIGSIAADMAADVGETPFYYYLIAMTVFFLFDLLVSYLGRKTPGLKNFLKGSPTTVIYDGKIDYKQLKKSKLDINDLLGMCRVLGYFDIKDIAYAIFETSGKLSIMPKGAEKPVVVSDVKEQYEKATLPNYLVIDGRISYSGLNELKKDVNWLYNGLNIKNRKELNNIILASYDDIKEDWTIHYKHKDSN